MMPVCLQITIICSLLYPVFSGLLIYPDGPLNPIIQSWRMSDMFLPFQSFLQKIKYLCFFIVLFKFVCTCTHIYVYVDIINVYIVPG